jgi:uncharacterized protein YjdB
VRDGAVILPRHVDALAVGGTLAKSLWINGVKVCVKYIPVTEVSLSARITISLKQTLTVFATVAPLNATDKRVMGVISSDLVEVLNPGWTERIRIRAGNKAGTAYITVTSIDGPSRTTQVIVR